jgi:K+-transporting ATPase ATPase C chain
MGIIKNLRIACLMTITTTIILGVLYPLAVTGLAQVFFPLRASGELLVREGRVVGSHLIGTTVFFLTAIFILAHLALELGYDASSGGSHQLGPTNHQLIDRVRNDVDRLRTENSLTPVPIDLVTESASGLDRDISPAAS